MHQSGGQGHTLTLSAGQSAHFLAELLHAQAGEDGLGLVVRQLPGLGGQAQKDLLQHGAFRLNLRRLGQIFQPHIGVPRHGAAIRLLRPRQDSQQGGFPGAIDADHAQLVSGL